jgi:adenosyl cobinamide kinase/adenosyl cobinamide phosphate guanylyltransferase
MPSLDTVDVSASPQSVLVYGAPKSGKTELVGQLASEFNLHWFDLENGFITLKKLPTDWQKRIDLHRILDNKDNPNAINTMMKVLSGGPYTVCDKHGKTSCMDCKRDKESTSSHIKLNDLDVSKDIVVVDSFTQLANSANAHAGRDLKEDGKFEFDHWRMQGIYLEKVLDFCQNANFNVIMITHEEGIEQETGGEKIMPAGGTKNFSRKVAKYFGHIIYCSVTNKKHKRSSNTTDNARIVTGSRTDIDVSEDAATILDIFRGKGSSVNASKNAGESSSAGSSVRDRLNKAKSKTSTTES